MTDNKTVICRDMHGGTKEVDISELYFRPSVYGVVIKDDKVLLSPQFDDGYDMPGGGVDLGEPLEEAVIREVREETGLTVAVKDTLLVADDLFTHPGTGRHMHSILIYYLCEYVSGEISTDGFDEHEKEYAGKAVWIPIKDLDILKFYNSVDSPSIIRKANKLIK